MIRKIATHLLSLGTIFVAAFWVYASETRRITDNVIPTEDRIEPILTLLGLITAYWSFIVEPGLRRQSDKADLIKAIKLELFINNNIFNAVPTLLQHDFAEGSIVYPRFVYSAIDRALASSTFSYKSHSGLVQAMVDARYQFERTNAMSAVSEIALTLSSREGQQNGNKMFLTGGQFTFTNQKFKVLNEAVQAKYPGPVTE